MCGQTPTCEAAAEETLAYCNMDPIMHPTGWEDANPDEFITYHANYATNQEKKNKLKKMTLWGAGTSSPGSAKFELTPGGMRTSFRCWCSSSCAACLGVGEAFSLEDFHLLVLAGELSGHDRVHKARSSRALPSNRATWNDRNANGSTICSAPLNSAIASEQLRTF
eukprot:CAMPEP_0183537544 /NCGR_PEP_ID=MMETSP0371-20130417/28992_1 /TAXON_ID=268820 /ORGANISM="Peridinium aciculiferum, Strain PAER-2" /LENGTH=165 /DNA_ID=CAMNT_0025738269 /DNA_START=30 /DNA_END=526 /DNA_ORIENTATION=+